TENLFDAARWRPPVLCKGTSSSLLLLQEREGTSVGELAIPQMDGSQQALGIGDTQVIAAHGIGPQRRPRLKPCLVNTLLEQIELGQSQAHITLAFLIFGAACQ